MCVVGSGRAVRCRRSGEEASGGGLLCGMCVGVRLAKAELYM